MHRDHHRRLCVLLTLFMCPLTSWLNFPTQCGFAVADCGPDQTAVTVFDFTGP